MPKIFTSLSLLFAFFLAIASLASGAAYLGTELPGGLPLGNAIAALAVCSLAGVSVVLTPPAGHPRVLAWVALAASACWLPASITLAGNLSLNFSGSRGTIWLAFTLMVGALVVISRLWAAWLQVLCAFRRALASK